MSSRGRKLAWNTITSLLMQVTTVVCGFILPRLILSQFGSEVNGLVNSITQFLGVVSLLDLGVGAVVQSALYKPLANQDQATVSKVFVSATKFFKRLAMILLVYVTILLFIYPLLINNTFGFVYTALLIAAICINSFSQYYFGIVNNLLLTADQKGYIQYTAQIVALIANTIICTILIKLGGSIQMVKLTTSLIFLCRPLYLNWYVRKHYKIYYSISYDEEPIKQKWNGMAQHFASYILSGTDNIVLTFFSTLSNVSIYSVYNTVIIGVTNVLRSMTSGFQSLMGEMIAKKETDKLNRFFGYVEWILHTGTILIFGCTGVLLVSFVSVYTKGVTDADYIQPLFAVLITVANAGHCLRLPYNILILAAGHYKQTQSNYIIAMLLNIVISIATVKLWGLIGVTIGTLIAMAYQTVWMAWYDSKNIIQWPMKTFFKQVSVDALSVILCVAATFKIPMISLTYYAFFLRTLIVFLCWAIIMTIINLIFYREKTVSVFTRVKNKILRRT